MNKYDLWRSKYLMLLTAVIIFSLLYLFSYLKVLEILDINSNNYLTENSRSYEVTINNQDDLQILKEAIKEMDIVEVGTVSGLKLFYFNEQAQYRPTMKMFKNESELQYNIVLGKEKYDSYKATQKEEYELILKEGAVSCNVVGIIETVQYDFKDFSEYVLINFKSDSVADFNGIYKIEGDTALFISMLEKSNISLDEQNMELLVLSGGKFQAVQLMFMVIVILLFSITMVLIVKLWFSLYVKEAGVRITFGAHKGGILFYILRKYIISLLLGIGTGLIIFYGYFQVFLNSINVADLTSSMFISSCIVFGFSLLIVVGNYLGFRKKSIREILEN